MTLTLSDSGFLAGVGPQGWMRGETDVLTQPTEHKQTDALACSSLLGAISDQLSLIRLLLACLLRNFL